MENRRIFWTTAVLLSLLLLLAACGGGTAEEAIESSEDTSAAEEMADEGLEATGSESAGNPLPTPISGVKAPPTRVGTPLQSLDILFVIQTPLTDTIDLQRVADWTAVQPDLVDVHYALFMFGGDALGEPVSFTADVEELTAVLNQPSAATGSALPSTEAIIQAAQLPGWRSDNVERLLILLTSTPVELSEEEMSNMIGGRVLTLAPNSDPNIDTTTLMIEQLTDLLTE
ncbi:MAG: hypothetical protein GY796_16800 [Chloroflexi bacterium]|nr:hypothetical protein [Chloroflexota bacterium]